MKRKVTITADEILVEGFPARSVKSQLFTCRTHANESVAWALKRLAEELQKSLAFYRTGEATDRIIDGD